MTPHRVDVNEIERFFASAETVAASATTADRSQRKRLYRVQDTYVTGRRYLGDGDHWEVVYSGPSLNDAVAAYNRLS